MSSPDCEKQLIPDPGSVRGEDFWIDELQYQLGRPLTPTGRDYLRTWLRAFAAHVKRQALLQPPAAPEGAWQPMDTAPKEGPFLVCWASRLRGGGEVKPEVEMVGGLYEYEECRSYGEPEAYGWHPLPRALTSPMTVSARQEGPHE